MDDDDFDPDAGHHGEPPDGAQADPMDEVKHELSRKDVVLFVIDVREPMLRNKMGNVPFAFMALECAATCMADRVVSAESDLLGIVLAGTRDKANEFGFENHVVLSPLAEPRAARIRELRNRIGEATELGVQAAFEDFGGPMDGSFAVSSSLHLAQLTLNVPATKNATKRVFWFTCADHAGAPPARLPRPRELPRALRRGALAPGSPVHTPSASVSARRASRRRQGRGVREGARHARAGDRAPALLLQARRAAAAARSLLAGRGRGEPRAARRGHGRRAGGPGRDRARRV